MSALGLRYHYHDVCRVMELLSISIADSNQILIFPDRWETDSETDTLYLNSQGRARLTHYSLLIIFILSIVACHSLSLSLSKYCYSLGLFVYFHKYSELELLECFSSSYWNTNTTILQSVILNPTLKLSYKWFYRKERFLLNENQIFLHCITLSTAENSITIS